MWQLCILSQTSCCDRCVVVCFKFELYCFSILKQLMGAGHFSTFLLLVGSALNHNKADGLLIMHKAV